MWTFLTKCLCVKPIPVSLVAIYPKLLNQEEKEKQDYLQFDNGGILLQREKKNDEKNQYSVHGRNWYSSCYEKGPCTQKKKMDLWNVSNEKRFWEAQALLQGDIDPSGILDKGTK